MAHNIFKPRAVRPVSTRIRWLSEEDTMALVAIWRRHGAGEFRSIEVEDIFPKFRYSTHHLKFNSVIIQQRRGVFTISDTIRARFEKSYGSDSV